MEESRLRDLPPRLLAAGLAILIVLVSRFTASGYTPEDRAVEHAVGRAIQFLEGGSSGRTYQDSRPGAQALVGLALLKKGQHPPNHPKIVSVAGNIAKAIQDTADRGTGLDIYSAALSLIFFVTADRDRYATQIDWLLGYLQSKQKPHGGWGYDIKKTGDTSMTQNAVLSLWEANKAGVRVPVDMVDGALIWLLKTQDPSGGFGYQGNVSNDFTPVQQAGIRPSMSGAGLGSLYVCADLLNIGKEPEKTDDLPPALKEIKKKEPPLRSRVNPQLVHQALARGKAWMDKNFEIEDKVYKYALYNLYTVERYHTFRGMAEGKKEGEPGWYNDGVRYLLRTQKEDGSWEDSCGATAGTAFGVLFLIRSTLISVGERALGGDMLTVGRGLPNTLAGLTVVGGNVVAKPKLGSLDKVLAEIDNASSPDSADALQALARLPAEEAETLVEKHAKKLRELAGDDSAEARYAAVQALGKRRDLDHVPTLIYALTDPDPVIAKAARDSLRRISRKFQGFGMPDNPTELERHTAIRKWQAWYLALRPDAEFEQ